MARRYRRMRGVSNQDASRAELYASLWLVTADSRTSSSSIKRRHSRRRVDPGLAHRQGSRVQLGSHRDVQRPWGWPPSLEQRLTHVPRPTYRTHRPLVVSSVRHLVHASRHGHGRFAYVGRYMHRKKAVADGDYGSRGDQRRYFSNPPLAIEAFTRARRHPMVLPINYARRPGQGGGGGGGGEE